MERKLVVSRFRAGRGEKGSEYGSKDAESFL